MRATPGLAPWPGSLEGDMHGRRMAGPVVLAMIVASWAGGLAQAAPPAPTDAAVQTRVDALLARLSLEEKIGQLNQAGALPFPGSPKVEDVVARGGAGSVLWLNDTRKFNEVQRIAVERSPSKIPLLFGLDVIHGYRTIFPVPLAMASSWDPAVPERAQAVAAREARAAGIHWTFGPMVDIARDARWGRIVEGAGEDPFLGSAMAAAQVRGFQGPTLGAEDRLVACAKHFAGYGAADGGRDYDPVYLSESQLRNVYLPPFHAAARAGVGTFMSAYMDLNDVPASGSSFLLRDVLKGEWGFQGFVVSDAMAVGSLVTQGFARDGRDAAYRALRAGLDMDMASNTFPPNLAGLVADGTLKIAEIDDAVRRILTIKVRMGLFEHPYTDESLLAKVVASPEHRKESRWAARRSMVLLRNEARTLPLSKDLTSIAVIGPLADSQEATDGSWMVFGHTSEAVTVLQGIKARLANAKVEHAPGPEIRRDIPSFFDALIPGKKKAPPQTPEQAEAAFREAVATARASELVVMVLGETADMAGEAASRASIDLPGRQQELLEAVVALGKPVVLVLLNGRPLSIAWAAEHVPAILEAWEPGSEGGHAVADVLFGEVNPGGKLPVTFPRKTGQTPLYYARTLTHSPEGSRMYNPRYWDGAVLPLFPFGFGLSYTTFSFANLKVSAPHVKVGEELAVTVDVNNTGSVAGDEVVQLYVHQKAGSDSRPMRELKGFERVTLQPGEKKTVTFELGPDELRYWSTSAKGWVQDAEAFDVWVGGDSRATLSAGFTVVR
jgi:beta-glucosidase